MPTSAFEIYLIMLCDGIKGWMVIACIVSTVLCIFGGGTWFVWSTEQEHLAKRGLRLFKCSAVVFVIAALLSCIVPSTKTAIMMVSTPAVVNSALLQKDTPEVLRGIWSGLMEQGVMEKAQKEVKRECATDPVMFEKGVMSIDTIREHIEQRGKNDLQGEHERGAEGSAQ